jgi:hypothetical protein
MRVFILLWARLLGKINLEFSKFDVAVYLANKEIDV